MPEELGPKETTTTNVIPPCAFAFGTVDFEVDRDRSKAKSVSNAVDDPQRVTKPIGGTLVTAVRLDPKQGVTVDYKPLITMRIRDPKNVQPNKFEIGLIQNLLSIEERFEYSSGVTVRSRCNADLPLRDADDDPQFGDTVFMSNRERELAKMSFQRTQARLQIADTPGVGALLELANNPLCAGKKTGTLTNISSQNKFRTWVAVRFKGDASCMVRLHHVDWQMNWAATVNPDKTILGEFKVLEPDGDGTPAPTLGSALANTECRGDDACD